ncbi:MAG: hypothetical protein KKG47_12395 [Proteobacteria bacterium]|nr:hypothetical protein [Pseudomonadota bacterium]
MKGILLFLLIMALSGCSVGVRTPLVDARFETGSKLLGINSGVRVVFPDRHFDHAEALSERYGPAWRNIQGGYPEYRFN